MLRLLIAFFLLISALQQGKSVNSYPVECDTLFHINGDTIAVRIYKYNSSEVLYKLCDEYNRPVRRIKGDLLYKIYILSEAKSKKYSPSRKEMERRAQKKYKKDSDKRDKSRAFWLGGLAGGIVGSIMANILSSLYPTNFIITTAVSLFTALLIAFSAKVKKYRWIAVVSAGLFFLVGLVLINLFNRFL